MNFGLFLEELAMHAEWREEDESVDLDNLSLMDIMCLVSETYESHQGWLCLDCEGNTLIKGEYYMVTDEVWKSVVKRSSGMMCVVCLEARLGRQLTPEDFIDAPINKPELNKESSDLLRDRLGIG